MFLETINLQANPEQKARCLPLAEEGKILGAYAQTELGHGTFLRGLETVRLASHNYYGYSNVSLDCYV